MATKIFLNNVWQDYDYEYLYNNLGVTRTKSKNIVAYDSSMNEISGWYNSGYNWIVKDNQWYSENTTPYYVFTETSIYLYLIDNQEVFPIYIENGSTYVIKDGSFLKPSFLHDNYGYTNTPSVVWEVDDQNVPISWYNLEENLYWDNINKVWSIDPPRQLPTVSLSNSFDGTASNWLYVKQNAGTSIEPNATFTPVTEKDFVSNAVYDPEKSYAIVYINKTFTYFSGGIYPVLLRQIQIVESNSCVAWKNVDSVSVSLSLTKVAVCSSNIVTIVTVYRIRDGVARNSFKYTVNNTDYYYVLERTREDFDWTDDLSSIGYTLSLDGIEVYAYFNPDKSPYRNDYWQTMTLYDEDGIIIPYDSTKTYTALSYRSSETDAEVATSRPILNRAGEGWLGYDAQPYRSYQRLTYRIS